MPLLSSPGFAHMELLAFLGPLPLKHCSCSRIPEDLRLMTAALYSSDHDAELNLSYHCLKWSPAILLIFVRVFVPPPGWPTNPYWAIVQVRKRGLL